MTQAQIPTTPLSYIRFGLTYIIVEPIYNRTHAYMRDVWFRGVADEYVPIIFLKITILQLQTFIQIFSQKHPHSHVDIVCEGPKHLAVCKGLYGMLFVVRLLLLLF